MKLVTDASLLRQVSEPVLPQEMQCWKEKLQHFLKFNHAAGISAPQLNAKKRAIAVRMSPHPGFRPQVLIMGNPEIIESSGQTWHEEGCLSFPGQTFKIRRDVHIKAKYLDSFGKEAISEFTGLDAFKVQHEVDHLNGKIIIDGR